MEARWGGREAGRCGACGAAAAETERGKVLAPDEVDGAVGDEGGGGGECPVKVHGCGTGDVDGGVAHRATSCQLEHTAADAGGAGVGVRAREDPFAGAQLLERGVVGGAVVDDRAGDFASAGGRALKCEGVLLAAGCGIGGGELEQTRAGLIDISTAGPEARTQVEHGRARFASPGIEKRAGVSAGA